MAQQHAPIYREKGKTYHADSCDPLIEAVDNGELELAAIGRATYPGERMPVFYGAYVRDLDGNKICFYEMKT